MALRFLTIPTVATCRKSGSRESRSRRPSTKRRSRTSRAWSSRREFWSASRRLIKRDRRKLDAKLLRAAFSRPSRKSARWDGGWRGRASAVALSKPVMKYLSNGATNPIHARYYCGGKPAQVRIRAHPPPAAPSFAASKTGSFGAGSTLQTPNATERSMIAEVLGLIWRAAGTYSKDGDNCPMQLRRRVQTHRNKVLGTAYG